MIDAPLKCIEEKFKVEIRAIQDDMAMMGDPEQIFGPGNALESLLELLAKVNFSPNRVKFQCIGTTDGALDNAPDWLIFDEETGMRRGGIELRNLETGEVVLNQEASLSEKVYGAQVCRTPIGSVFRVFVAGRQGGRNMQQYLQNYKSSFISFRSGCSFGNLPTTPLYPWPTSYPPQTDRRRPHSSERRSMWLYATRTRPCQVWTS
jgi:hypothetical protein